MTGFFVKLIHQPESLGAELRRRREAKGWTLTKASRETRLLPSYLRFIEEEKFHGLPDGPARSNFVKTYIRALGDSPELYLQANIALAHDKPGGTAVKKTPPRQIKFSWTPRHLKMAALGLALAAVAAYLGMEIQSLLEPPLLTVTAPSDGFVSNVPTVNITGATEENAKVLVNKAPISKKPNGDWNATVDLERGTNIITIEAKRAHSRTRTLYRTIIFTNPSDLSLNP